MLKIYTRYTATEEEKNIQHDVFPRIVIYPATGKAQAQKVLEILFVQKIILVSFKKRH